VHDLAVQYDSVTALEGVDFAVRAGDFVALIGPNGAGKSTTIKMLSGILVPTGGVIEVKGLDPSRQRADHTHNIGVVFGQRTALWWDVPLIDSLLLLKDIYKIPEARFHNNLRKFTELLDLKEFEHVPVRQLSLGQRVRADIAAALLHDPSILFLDEPTIGVDVMTKDRLRHFIHEVNRDRKVTIILTTHDMNEIERLCPRVILIDHGRLLYDGSIERIKSLYGSERILQVEFEQPVPDFSLDQAELKRSDGRKKWFSFNRLTTPVSTLIASVSAQYPVVDLTVEDPEIEDVIRSIYLDNGVRLQEGSRPA